MDSNEKFELITRNLQEVIGEDDLKKLLDEKKEVSVYWGTAPTGSPSLAYFFPMMKVADFLRAGVRVTILLADLHAALDSTPWNVLDKRTAYYEKAIVMILEAIGVSVKNLHFVRGRDIQMSKEYYMDLLKLSTYTTQHDANKAGSEVVKQGKNPKLAGMIYPLMQALDEEYLKVDMQFGGVDQRKIMVYAREHLPKLGYKPRIELMNPMIRGLSSEKMSSSDANSKIDLFDDEKTVKKKINKAECVEGDSDNGLMSIAQYIVFGINDTFTIERDEKYGGNLTYNSFDELKSDFESKKLHPMDLKSGVASAITHLLNNFQENKEFLKLYKEAYSEKN